MPWAPLYRPCHPTWNHKAPHQIVLLWILEPLCYPNDWQPFQILSFQGSTANRIHVNVIVNNQYFFIYFDKRQGIWFPGWINLYHPDLTKPRMPKRILWNWDGKYFVIYTYPDKWPKPWKRIWHNHHEQNPYCWWRNGYSLFSAVTWKRETWQPNCAYTGRCWKEDKAKALIFCLTTTYRTGLE